MKLSPLQLTRPTPTLAYLEINQSALFSDQNLPVWLRPSRDPDGKQKRAIDARLPARPVRRPPRVGPNGSAKPLQEALESPLQVQVSKERMVLPSVVDPDPYRYRIIFNYFFQN